MLSFIDVGGYRRGGSGGGGDWSRREGEERARTTEKEKDGDSGQRKGGGGTGNAWAKGMPRSFGGPDKPVILLRKKAEEEVPVSAECQSVSVRQYVWLVYTK